MSTSVIEVAMAAGKSAVEISLLTLLPIMVVMLCIMRLLEAAGVIDWVVRRLEPVLRPFGLTGLSVLAALQMNLVSFAAPVATLAIMDKRGSSDRHIAATLAMTLSMAQANLVFPLAAFGLKVGQTMIASVVGGLIAAAMTYHVFGKSLSIQEGVVDQHVEHEVVTTPKSVIGIIQHGGAEAFKIAVGAIPMLALALVAVALLQNAGAFEWINRHVSGLLETLRIDPIMVVPTLTKYLGGGTAVLGVLSGLRTSDVMSALALNQSAGWLVHSLDLPGLAILAAAGPRVARHWKPAVLGALVGIAVRVAVHILCI